MGLQPAKFIKRATPVAKFSSEIAASRVGSPPCVGVRSSVAAFEDQH